MIKITIETENAAFDPSAGGHPNYEVARILRKFAGDYAEGKRPLKVMDINGNTVGAVTYD